jgi:hypothetical protein
MDVTKELIERLFLQHYASGNKNEFQLNDRLNNLTFPELKSENPKKVKDVAVSLVRASFLRGELKQTASDITVITKGITPEGLRYLKTISPK